MAKGIIPSCAAETAVRARMKRKATDDLNGEVGEGSSANHDVKEDVEIKDEEESLRVRCSPVVFPCPH
jgi:hypothetical protein